MTIQINRLTNIWNPTNKRNVWNPSAISRNWLSYPVLFGIEQFQSMLCCMKRNMKIFFVILDAEYVLAYCRLILQPWREFVRVKYLTLDVPVNIKFQNISIQLFASNWLFYLYELTRYFWMPLKSSPRSISTSTFCSFGLSHTRWLMLPYESVSSNARISKEIS